MADPAQALDAELTLEQLLDFVTVRKAQATRIQDELTAALEQLNGLVESGELDPQFAFNDWSFNWSAGRTTWDYPGEVKEIEAILKTSKKAAEADGTATAKTGAPFWTIRAPKQ
jgi:hypothetical protein